MFRDVRTWIIISLGVIIAILLASCGPASKLRRAERLINKAEELGAKWHIDSIRVEVPVFIIETRVDSIFIQKQGDTVVLEKERLKVKIMRLPGDTVKVEAECSADTVRVQVTKVITTTIEAKSGLGWYWLIVAAAGGMILSAIIKIIK